ncbi:MAG: hypothetical protein ED556_02995 [Winogradskyella sp.]|uniref:hypothetical protein n=1 Tax=Winogradskyella sp. TaxID=1883156 RepID=UPI000F3D81E4|nr:hypothetical protein [Winogradskyella sp.]RNC88166.1 MAG: hypothetical protein ED556_02995 [Winogradskyella sp.]
MKNRLPTLVILLFIITTACKEKKTTRPQKPVMEIIDNKNEVETKIVEGDSIYRIIISGVFQEDGVLALNYIDDPNEKYNSKQTIVKKFKQNIAPQTLTFEFPTNAFIEQFRIRPNFKSQEPKDLRVNSIIVSFNSKEIKFDASNYTEYFRGNSFVKITEGDSVFRFKKNVVNGKLTYDPFILSKPEYTNLVLEEL